MECPSIKMPQNTTDFSLESLLIAIAFIWQSEKIGFGRRDIQRECLLGLGSNRQKGRRWQ